jgi:hypothetical protein
MRLKWASGGGIVRAAQEGACCCCACGCAADMCAVPALIVCRLTAKHTLRRREAHRRSVFQSCWSGSRASTRALCAYYSRSCAYAAAVLLMMKILTDEV